MAPIRLLREKQEAVTRKAKLEAELAALPGRIADLDTELAKLGEEYIPFKTMEKP